MTSPHLEHLRPPPTKRVAAVMVWHLATRGGGVFLLSLVWELGATIAWWLISVAIVAPLIMALWVAAALVISARSHFEKAIAAERLAAARFPFWPVVLTIELLLWVLIGRVLHVTGI